MRFLILIAILVGTSLSSQVGAAGPAEIEPTRTSASVVNERLVDLTWTSRIRYAQEYTTCWVEVTFSDQQGSVIWVDSNRVYIQPDGSATARGHIRASWTNTARITNSHSRTEARCE